MRPGQFLAILLAAILLPAGTGVGAVDSVWSPVQSDGNVTTFRAIGPVADDITGADDIRALRANGTLSTVGPDERIITGDTLVIRIRSTVLNETFAETSGVNTTDRFFRMLDGPTNVTVRALVGPEVRPFELALARSDPHVARDITNATFYIIVDTRSVVLTERHGNETFDPVGDHAEFEVRVETRDRQGPEALEDRFELAFPDATVDATTAGLRLRGGSPARVAANTTTLELSAETNLLPETNVTVRAVGSNGTVLVSDRTVTTTNSSGGPTQERGRSNFSVTLAGLPTDEVDWFTLRATGHNNTLWERRVVVGPPPRWSNLSASVVKTTGTTWTAAVNATVTLPDQGLVRVELQTVGSHDTRVVAVPEGRSRQHITVEGMTNPPAGPVEVEIYWDSDGNGELTLPDDTGFTTTANLPQTNNGELRAELPIDGVDQIVLTTTPEATAVETSEAGSGTTEGRATTVEGVSGTPDRKTPTRYQATTDTTAADGPGFDFVAALVAVLLSLLAACRH